MRLVLVCWGFGAASTGALSPLAKCNVFWRKTTARWLRSAPEVMGGLSIPHPPHEQKVVDGRIHVVDAEGNDHTDAFETGACAACKLAVEAGCTHAILKAKSPSCGVGQVYDGTFTDTLIPGNGIAAKLLEEAGLTVATEKDFLDVFCDC